LFYLLYAAPAVVAGVLMARYARVEPEVDPATASTSAPALEPSYSPAETPMTLAAFWFVVLAILWTGFLLLEGFDFGVGALHAVVGRDEAGRRVAIRTISPVWDGNEVWLIVAVAVTFGAFPSWFATMLSAFYPSSWWCSLG